MSRQSNNQSTDKNLGREERLAKNLRDNLKRRKQAARKQSALKEEDKSSTLSKN